MTHFLDMLDVTPDQLRALLADAAYFKAAGRKKDPVPVLCNRVVALVFEKPSLRTRVSFETAVAHLGGTSLFLPSNEVGLGWRESVADFARTMSQYVDAMVLRVFRHATVTGVAAASTVPVINGLSDASHPCQALADLLTVQEQFGKVEGRTVVFVGDGNNVARSLAVGCGKLGAKFVLASPAGYGFEAAFVKQLKKAVPGFTLEQTTDPLKAVKAADVVYTDVWTSMGQEDEREARLKQFASYQVNAALMSKAPKSAVVLHCLPAHRGEEITDEVLDGDQCVATRQAENRLHVQKAVFAALMR